MGSEERRKHEQQAQARQAFAQALSAGDPHALPRDRFGVAIRPGMKVLYRPNVDMIFDVVDVRPVLDPRLPPGVVTIVLQAAAPVSVRIGQPVINMIVIATDAPKDGAEADPAPPVGEPAPPEEPVAPEEPSAPSALHLVAVDGD